MDQDERPLGVGAQVSEDVRRRLDDAAVERRAEDFLPEKVAGGGATDEGAVIGARDDVAQEIRRQLPRHGSLGRPWLLSSAIP